MDSNTLTIPTTSHPACGRGRAFHVVDIENLLALTRGERIEPVAYQLYRAVAGVGPSDLLTVAADRSRVFEVRTAFPGAEVRFGTGPDGADRALLDAIDVQLLARRFDTLVIGSGDHLFWDLAYRARSAGLKVVVVSRPKGLSRLLASQADEVIAMASLVDGHLPPDLTTAA